ncbi:MAG: GWxTD domain-containing protein [Gemmatimonadaceae bacterium]|nr:GWxTD domain-containing protein [Gemmatimonadaceae bacterium]
MRGPAGAAAPAAAAGAADMQRLYRTMGLVAAGGAMPFVSSLSFLRTPSPDSTLMLVALSFPSRVLGFQREGERYAASYSVRVQLRQGNTVVRNIEATETVRVPTYRETARTDESVIWQQFVRVAPGRYSMSVAVKDEGSIRNAGEDVTIEVPRLPAGALGSPLPVYEAIARQTLDSLPRILARPRATVAFGADSLFPIYVDAPGADAPSAITVRVLGEGDIVSWQNRTDLPARGASRSATVPIPVRNMGIGINTIEISTVGRADTVRTRVLVSLGDDLPIASFEDMVSYLRYFTTADRLAPLRNATPAQRATAWTQFLKDTDPVPATPEHEGLRDYFGRIRTANLRYRDEGAQGWQTDRGITYVALGDPDNIIDTGLNDPNARVRQQIWEYRELRIQLVFMDQTGFGRWRLSNQQRAELDNAIRRKLAQQR